MLSIAEYKLLYPKENIGEFKDIPLLPGCRFIKEGMLLFTEDTACSWGGPYDGNYAHFVVSDYTNATSPYPKDKGKKMLELWAKGKAELKAKIDRGFYSIHPTIYNDCASIEFPVRLWMLGNDDTSYSKFYKTEEGVLAELDLFIANEPLDFDIVHSFDFVFTN